MRYASNDLDQFSLHDAGIEEVLQDGPDLRLRLSHANVLDTCPANPHGRAMRAADMWLTLENFDLRAAMLPESSSYDPVTHIRTEIPPRSITAEELLQALREGAEILSANKQADEGTKHSFFFEISPRHELFMTFEFLADGIRFEWDEYAGLAWFEERRAIENRRKSP